MCKVYPRVQRIKFVTFTGKKSYKVKKRDVLLIYLPHRDSEHTFIGTVYNHKISATDQKSLENK